MATPDMTREISTAAAKASPAVVVTLLSKLGALTLADWVAVVTISYILLQTGHLAWTWAREWRASRRLRGTSGT